MDDGDVEVVSPAGNNGSEDAVSVAATEQEQAAVPELVRALLDRNRKALHEEVSGYGSRYVGSGYGTAVPTTPDETVRASFIRPTTRDSVMTPQKGDSLLLRNQRVDSAQRSEFEKRVQSYGSSHESTYAYHHGRSFVGVETMFEANSYMSYGFARNDKLGGAALMFMFYADLFFPPSEFKNTRLDFAALCHPNSSMNFKQWDWFCSDFGLYPKLLSRVEMVHAFRQSVVARPSFSGSLSSTYHLDFDTERTQAPSESTSDTADALQSERKSIDGLTYPQFIMALGRSAVLAYSKTALNSDELMSKKNKVGLLTEYLNLTRLEAVKLKLKSLEGITEYRKRVHFTDTATFAEFSGVALSNANTHYFHESSDITKAVAQIKLSPSDLVPITRADQVTFPEIWKHYMGSFVDLGSLVISEALSTRHKYNITITNSHTRSVRVQLDFSHVPFLEATYRFVHTVVLQLVSAVEHLHKHGVIHRDIKPNNILLSHSAWPIRCASGTTAHSAPKRSVSRNLHLPTGDECSCAEVQLKLADLGVARLTSDATADHAPDVSSTFCGTPTHMSPEVAMHGLQTTAVDMWSLGVVLYELCARRLPFDGSKGIAHLCAQITSHNPLAQAPPLPPRIPAPVVTTVAALLSKGPEQRPTAAHLRQRWSGPTVRYCMWGGSATDQPCVHTQEQHEHGTFAADFSDPRTPVCVEHPGEGPRNEAEADEDHTGTTAQVEEVEPSPRGVTPRALVHSSSGLSLHRISTAEEHKHKCQQNKLVHVSEVSPPSVAVSDAHANTSAHANISDVEVSTVWRRLLTTRRRLLRECQWRGESVTTGSVLPQQQTPQQDGQYTEQSECEAQLREVTGRLRWLYSLYRSSCHPPPSPGASPDAKVRDRVDSGVALPSRRQQRPQTAVARTSLSQQSVSNAPRAVVAKTETKPPHFPYRRFNTILMRFND